MKDFEKRNENIKESEDDISAAKTDINATEKPADDGFKTANKHEHRLNWEVPHDEQMMDTSADDKDDTEAGS